MTDPTRPRVVTAEAESGPAATRPAVETAAWPFVVGRGRTVGNRVLVLPEILAESHDGRLLGRLAAAGPADQPTVLEEWDSNGRPLSFVHLAATIGRSELDEIPAPEGTDAAVDDGPVKDEHGRPIVVLHGFVVPDRSISQIDASDLSMSRQHVLAVYRDLLAGDEAGFEPRLSEPFAMASEPGPGRVRVRETVDRRTADPGPQPRPDPGSPVADGAGRPALMVLLSLFGIVVMAAIGLTALVLAGGNGGGRGGDDPQVVVDGALLVASPQFDQDIDRDVDDPPEELDLRLTDRGDCLYAEDREAGERLPLIWPQGSSWIGTEEAVALPDATRYELDEDSDLATAAVDMGAVEDTAGEAVDRYLDSCDLDGGDRAVLVLIDD